MTVISLPAVVTTAPETSLPSSSKTTADTSPVELTVVTVITTSLPYTNSLSGTVTSDPACLTVISTFLLVALYLSLPAYVMVILVFPAFTAVIKPSLVTVTIFES